MSSIKTSKNIQDAYDEQYDERMTKWRELGGKYKSKNIIQVANGRSFKKVLDFGAGEGSILQFLDNNKQFETLYALEISESGINQIKNRNLNNLIEVKKFDGYKTAYADDEFDLAYCAHVIEHVEHPRLVLREIQRISKFQIFEIPLDYSRFVGNQVEHFLGYGHINIFTPALFQFLLKSEGFEIHEETHSSIAKEVLEFNWYQNMKLKPTLKRKIQAYIYSNRSKITRKLFGKSIANEFYHSAYTCFTSKTGKLKIM